MSGRTQYGDLLRDAGRHILVASVELANEQFADKDTAERAAIVYLDLLHALHRHGRQLMGSELRLRGFGATRDADPRDAAAARLVDHLAHVGRRHFGAEGCDAQVSRSWAAAASSVRAATDLLATHRDSHGGLRSPEAELLEAPEVRAAGFGELAAITFPVAGAGTTLGMRIREAGCTEVQRLVPEMAPLLEVAAETRRLGDLGGFSAPLAAMGVAKPNVRSGDPVVELGDRLARLHRVAWRLTREPRVGAGTLGELAAAGMFVNSYASRLLRHVPVSGAGTPVDLSARRAIAHLDAGAAAWRQVHLHVRQLRTTTPPITGLRADIVAVRNLLEELVVTPAAASRELQAVVVGGARSFGDVARWNVQVLDEMARRGQVLLPGRHLTGDEVSNHPALVEVKLNGGIVPAPKQHLEPLRAAYDVVRVAARGASGGVAPPVLLDHVPSVRQT